jgi:hypothetical protein
VSEPLAATRGGRLFKTMGDGFWWSSRARAGIGRHEQFGTRIDLMKRSVGRAQVFDTFPTTALYQRL